METKRFSRKTRSSESPRESSGIETSRTYSHPSIDLQDPEPFSPHDLAKTLPTPEVVVVIKSLKSSLKTCFGDWIIWSLN
jgi:hypothetical protein